MIDEIPNPQKEAEEKMQAALKARNEAIEKRAMELKINEGKWFRPKNPNPSFPNQIVKVVAYDGVKKTMEGEAHIYIVESWKPRQIWTPPAYKFLDEFELCEPQPIEPVTENNLPK